MAGALIAMPSGHLVLLAIAATAWLVLWSLIWRTAFVSLFLMLPVAAIPGILLQQQGWPTLLKDGLFLLPGYVGLTLTLMTRSRAYRWPLPRSLSLLLTCLVVVVGFQAIRLVPTIPLVALIGLRSWLLYVPLVLVPTFAFSSITDMQRVIRMLVMVSLVPALVGIAEFSLIVLGHADLAYQWYGGLGADVSQGFTQVGVSDQILVHRIPSTFTFVTQFVAYCLITTPICLVVMLSDADARWRRIGAVAAIAIVVAGFASGSRTFYLSGPIEIALTLLLIGRRRFRLAIVIAIAASVAALTVGLQLVQVATFITRLGWDYLVRVQAGEFPAVYQAVGLLGAGAGIDANGSRYVLASHTLPFGIEGWYALAFLELGLPGLILILLIWLVLLRRAWLSIAMTRGTVAGPIAVAVFVILASTIVNLYKGVSLEYDPLNVYFWFIAGLALALPQIGAHRPGLSEAAE
jgi:hypothetical protein